jgi:hypothetical protein
MMFAKNKGKLKEFHHERYDLFKVDKFLHNEKLMEDGTFVDQQYLITNLRIRPNRRGLAIIFDFLWPGCECRCYGDVICAPGDSFNDMLKEIQEFITRQLRNNDLKCPYCEQCSWGLDTNCTDPETEEIVRLYKKGKTWAEIMNIIGLDKRNLDKLYNAMDLIDLEPPEKPVTGKIVVGENHYLYEED